MSYSETACEINTIATLDLLRQLEQIQRGTYSICDLGLLEEAVETLLTPVPFVNFAIKTDALYRARICPTAEPFYRLDQLLAPPAAAITLPGRCNGPGESILYVSLSQEVAATEVRPEAGAYVCILKLAHTQRLELLDLGCRHRCLGKSGEGLAAERVKLTGYLQEAFGLNRTGLRNTLLVTDWLVDQFTRPVPPGHEQSYSLTIAVTRYLTRRNPERHGILYPSIEHVFHGQNAVLTAAAAAKLVQPVQCRLYRIVDTEDAFPAVNWVHLATGVVDSSSGTIAYTSMA